MGVAGYIRRLTGVRYTSLVRVNPPRQRAGGWDALEDTPGAKPRLLGFLTTLLYTTSSRFPLS